MPSQQNAPDPDADRMPTDVAAVIAEVADYAVALARLQARVLFDFDPAARGLNDAAYPSLSECARVSELLGRMVEDILVLAEPHGFRGEAHAKWLRERPQIYTAAAYVVE